MRNNRGEWEYRESYDKDNYTFIRNSGIKSWELDNKYDKKLFWSEVRWTIVALLFTVFVSCIIAFALGYLTGGA